MYIVLDKLIFFKLFMNKLLEQCIPNWRHHPPGGVALQSGGSSAKMDGWGRKRKNGQLRDDSAVAVAAYMKVEYLEVSLISFPSLTSDVTPTR